MLLIDHILYKEKVAPMYGLARKDFHCLVTGVPGGINDAINIACRYMCATDDSTSTLVDSRYQKTTSQKYCELSRYSLCFYIITYVYYILWWRAKMRVKKILQQINQQNNSTNPKL